MRLQAITCDMLLRPVEHFAETSPHDVVVERLSASLHAEPMTLRERIQAKVDGADAAADAVVLAYGLCGGATAGIEARDIPLVLPRAHDCTTIFLGSRERYQAEHEATPGTYWYTRDQLERGNALKGWLLGDAARSEDAMATRQDYERRFGKDNADYLMETLGEWHTRYERGAYLDTGLGGGDDDGGRVASDGGAEVGTSGGDEADEATAVGRAREESERRGWRFERVPSDLGLVRRLLHGEWDEDFQVVEPGQRLQMSYDDGIVRVADVVHGVVRTRR